MKTKLGFMLFSVTYRVAQQIDVSRKEMPQTYTPDEAWERMDNQHREMWEAEAELRSAEIQECLENVQEQTPPPAAAGVEEPVEVKPATEGGDKVAGGGCSASPCSAGLSGVIGRDGKEIPLAFCEPSLAAILQRVAERISHGLGMGEVRCDVENIEVFGRKGFSLAFAHRSITILAEGTCDDPDIGVNAFVWGFLKDEAEMRRSEIQECLANASVEASPTKNDE